MTEAQTFDLRSVSRLQYKNRFRLGRIISGVLVILIALGFVRTLFSGLNLAAVLILLLAGVAEFILLFGIFYLLAPGPVELRVLSGSLLFTFASGRRVSRNTTSKSFTLRLIERVAPSVLLRRAVEDPPHFASVRLRWFPLTNEAFAAIQSELLRAGLSSTLTDQTNAKFGGWRVLTYRSRSS
jgi:hypothetical protein